MEGCLNGFHGMEISDVDGGFEMGLEAAMTGEAGEQLQPETASTGNGLHDRKQRRVTSPDVWPFVKKSPAWASIESMEVFRNIPQNPHFRPLVNCKEEYREGAAIGIMVTYSNLFDTIASLRIHDSRDSFMANLDNLSDLEKHGFDVTVPRDRLNKLLAIKEPLSKWQNLIKNAEMELQQHFDERQKLVATMEEIEEKLLALQQTLAAAKTEKDATEARAAVVQSLASEMKGRVESACNEFERVAAAPWRLPTPAESCLL